MFEKRVMEMMYAKATRPEDLVWHREDPGRLLSGVVARRKLPGKALDVGCGAGVFSAYLARKGYAVTGLDFIPRALELAKERAAAENASVRFVLADLFEWRTSERFDVVLDSGCLHNFAVGAMRKYKDQLLSWLAPEGDYVLGHFGKRHALDWRPIGPRRRTRGTLVEFFAPELREQDYDCELADGIPLPIGPKVLLQSFWFRRGG